MKIKEIPIGDIIEAKYNPRVNLQPGDEEYEVLKKSIEDFDLVEPLVWNKRNNVLIGGHQRLKILKEKGHTKVHVSVVDLDDKKERALNLILNNENAQGGWEFTKLADLLMDLDDGEFDMDMTGFNEEQREDIATWTPPQEDNEVEEDEVPGIDDTPAITKPGELFTLGRHRLLCGDATKKEDVERLMDGKRADMVFTDPPYGIEVVGGNQKIGGGGNLRFGRVQKGGRSKNQWVDSKIYLKIENDISPDCAKTHMEICEKIKIEKYIIWGGNYFTGFLLPSRCWLVWHKETTAKFADIEFAWTNFNELPRLYKWTWNGLQREGNRTDELKARVHPTQKPVGLFVNILTDFEGNPILDCFLGSGTTLIAAEKLNRICYGMEIEPKYCDVIIKRYCNFTKTSEDEIRATVERQ